ncbi:hypothetical protein [Capnocytophaga canimorsus]|uniref:hypothetical protein n=1 Tax=Capnocytophaga canimorsus TaxID=28188 RepID=UPI003858B380
MKKIIISFLTLAVMGCTKVNEEIVENIIEKYPKAVEENSVSYYLEEDKPILALKKSDERFIAISQYDNSIFLGVETTTEDKKSYSIQKLDTQNGNLTQIITDLSHIKDIAISDKFIFVAQNKTVRAYNKNTYELEVIIGNGNQNDQNFGMFNTQALFLTNSHLLVRDEKRIRFFNLADITASNTKKVPTFLKTEVYSGNVSSITIHNNKLFMLRDLNGNKTIDFFDLNEKGFISENQLRTNFFSVASYQEQLFSFRNHLYSSLKEKGLGKLDEKANIEYQYKSHNNNPLQAQRFVFTQDKLYITNQNGGEISVFKVKDIVYRKY